jgi:hypothetical protein
MASKLAVWTSRYSNRGLARSGLVVVGITRWRPRFPLAYKVKANLSILAPSAKMLTEARAGNLTPRAFRAQYVRQLERVGVQNTLAALRQLQGKSKGLALVCYENVGAGERCHRRYLAAWLKVRAGLDVPELPDLAGPPAHFRPSKRSRQLNLFPVEEP